MSRTKFSRQRECIREYLRNTREHPTAEMVYNNVRLVFPNISLGTVYRNLNQMTAAGEIQRLDIGDGTEHFDPTVTPHNHFICKRCGKILDLRMEPLYHIDDNAIAGFDGRIDEQYTYFYGECPDCIYGSDT